MRKTPLAFLTSDDEFSAIPSNGPCGDNFCIIKKISLFLENFSFLRWETLVFEKIFDRMILERHL